MVIDDAAVGLERQTFGITEVPLIPERSVVVCRGPILPLHLVLNHRRRARTSGNDEVGYGLEKFSSFAVYVSSASAQVGALRDTRRSVGVLAAARSAGTALAACHGIRRNRGDLRVGRCDEGGAVYAVQANDSRAQG